MPNDTPAVTAGTCPVCGYPAREDSCGACGWKLRTPLRAGPVLPEQWQDFAGRLSDARGKQARRDGRELDFELGALVRELTPRAVSTVIDIGPEEIACCAVYLDSLGAPRVREAGRVTWTSALRVLPDDERIRHERLAHGIDGLSDDEVAGLVLGRLWVAGGDRTLAICRPAGWLLPEAVARALAKSPGTSAVRISRATRANPRSVLEELASRAPLRYTCYLMTAAIDRRTGSVTVRPRPLIPAGSARGGSARGGSAREGLVGEGSVRGGSAGGGSAREGFVTVWRPPGKATETALAVFAGAGPLDRAAYGPDATPAALYSVPLPARSRLEVRAVIDGPGRLRITGPRGAVPHRRTWAEICRQVPGQVPVPLLTRVDLVCAVDMAGDPETVRRRVELVGDLVEFLAQLSPDSSGSPGGDGPRFGLVTCTDHVIGRRPGRWEYEPVTRVHDLGTAADAIAWLGEAPAAGIMYPGRAPVEDLLDESLRLLRRSRAAGRLPLLLTVAGRLPHPAAQPSSGPHPCPGRLDWKFLMHRLIHDAGTACRVVADALPRESTHASQAERDDREAWRGLGPGGPQYTLGEATARKLAEGFRILPPDNHPLPLPLADGSLSDGPLSDGPDGPADGRDDTEGDAAR